MNTIAHSIVRFFAVGAIGGFAVTAAQAANVDAEAAKYVARANGCFQCHAIDMDKDGPAYQKVAAKFRNDPDGEKRIIFHLTSGEKAKFPDGHEEEHKIIRTIPKNDFEQISNLVKWILSQ